jgi:hypothetical protein
MVYGKGIKSAEMGAPIGDESNEEDATTKRGVKKE